MVQTLDFGRMFLPLFSCIENAFLDNHGTASCPRFMLSESFLLPKLHLVVEGCGTNGLDPNIDYSPVGLPGFDSI